MPFEEGGWEYEPLMYLNDRQSFIDYFGANVKYTPLDTVPCPPGLTEEECDTLEAMVRHRLGFEGGRCYYRFFDRSAKNGLPYFYKVTSATDPTFGDAGGRLFRWDPDARTVSTEIVSFE